MSRLHYNLPPFAMLSAFEAAARKGSFKAAASELNVTPGAVSHQIKALEAELGVALFRRVHRGVELSDEGGALAQALMRGFGDISQALRAARLNGENPALTIRATTAVATLWLAPRLARFWREHRGIRIDQVISDSPDQGLDNSDFAITYGLEQALDPGRAEPLFRDELIALASPAFVAEHPDPDLAALARLPLVHLRAQDRNWTGWRRWFAGLGYDGPVAGAMEVNSYMIALQAAIDGAGVVLGWRHLVAPMLRAGQLCQLGEFRLMAPEAFYLSCRRMPAPDSNGAVLWQWLLGLEVK